MQSLNLSDFRRLIAGVKLIYYSNNKDKSLSHYIQSSQKKQTLYTHDNLDLS